MLARGVWSMSHCRLLAVREKLRMIIKIVFYKGNLQWLSALLRQAEPEGGNWHFFVRVVRDVKINKFVRKIANRIPPGWTSSPRLRTTFGTKF